MKYDDSSPLHGGQKGSGLHGRAVVIFLDEVLGCQEIELLQIVRVEVATT